MFHPHIPDEGIGAYFLNHEEKFGYAHCTAPWVMAQISPNGDIVTCRDFPDVVVGNITTESILDAWNGERMLQFRRVLKRHDGVLPICTRCHGLMGC
jgi:radical SAM protein with 4Fe4S-binding SPASM domain